MGRVLLAAIASAIAMYVVMSVAHMSPIAQTGISQMTNEAPALAAVQSATANKPGLYLFPSVDMKAADAMAKMDAARKTEPSGILVYQPPGAPGMTPKMLLTEFVAELVETLIAAILLAMAALGTYGSRFVFVLLVGIVSSIATNISYWNWYAFPENYTLTNMGIEFAGFVAAALVLAALVKPRRI